MSNPTEVQIVHLVDDLRNISRKLIDAARTGQDDKTAEWTETAMLNIANQAQVITYAASIYGDLLSKQVGR